MATKMKSVLARNHFNRVIETPGYRFDGKQFGTFTELNFIRSMEVSEWIVGANLWTDDFSEKQLTSTPLRDYNQTTLGAFVQNNLKLSEKVNLETGLRGDYVIDYGFALLPRVSLLYKANPKFSTRIGGGFGYKTTTQSLLYDLIALQCFEMDLMSRSSRPR